MLPKAPPPKPKPKMDPSPPPPKKPELSEEAAGSPDYNTPTGLGSNSGSSTPKTVSLAKYNELVAKFNQLKDALIKVCECKDHYKIKSVSLSGSLTNNVDALKDANKLTKELEQECNEIAIFIGLDKDVIIAAARDSGQATDMFSRATVPPFLAEENTNARVWFDNLLKFKDSMRWNEEQTNRFGQLVLVGKASKFLTLYNSTSLATLGEFKKVFLEC